MSHIDLPPLSRRSLDAVWHPCTQMQHHDQGVPLPAILRAQGAWLHDQDGKRYLDAISSWWVNLFGHSHPHIINAISEQLHTLDHIMLCGLTHEPVVQLSEQLAALTGNRLGHAFYGSDGASAVEIALKLSAQYWRNQGQAHKHRFVGLQQGYHGETLGALAVTDVPLFREHYDAQLATNYMAASPDLRQAAHPDEQQAVTQAALDSLETVLRQHTDIAAVILEPLVQCAAGMVMHAPAYLRGVRALCDRYQVHLILDEIAVGCGRTGRFFACEHADIWPDLLCLSKGITGGTLPLSVVLSSHTLYQGFYDPDLRRGFLHSHSYSGNPLACRAALATLELFRELPVFELQDALARELEPGLQDLATRHPNIRHLRRCGMIWAFDLDTGPMRHDHDAFARRFYRSALRYGLLLRPIANTVYIMPGYIWQSSETHHLLTGLHDLLKEYA
ncbi:adenosylmethionine--8-amino-7-oxononanoate transaminase [Alcaligenes sp. SDU_A2]|uniref:adenosylmethionine--8-amino-7-oxononanoate transaminase n=1 Tax=Alcaligenes sp. SDU_A2 TaxID=3136634 RepID=UPI00311FB49D